MTCLHLFLWSEASLINFNWNRNFFLVPLNSLICSVKLSSNISLFLRDLLKGFSPGANKRFIMKELNFNQTGLLLEQEEVIIYFPL